MKKNTIVKILGVLISIITLLGSAIAAVSALFYKVAFARVRPKSSVKITKEETADESPVVRERIKNGEEAKAYVDQRKTTEMNAKSFDGLNLYAKLLWADDESSDKIAILIHGYHGTPYVDFGGMIQFWHERGYQVLLPDNRAHRNSEGEWLGFGWNDRMDIIMWAKHIVDLFGPDCQIVLSGVSMGAAGVMMASGEGTLPTQVKAIVEDCGFTSALDMFHHIFPKNLNFLEKPIFLFANLYSKIFNHYDLREASSLEELRRTKVPVLFIHGEEDNFVPTEMVYSCYAACKGWKDIITIPGASHAAAYITEPEVYKTKVTEFLEKMGL